MNMRINNVWPGILIAWGIVLMIVGLSTIIDPPKSFGGWNLVVFMLREVFTLIWLLLFTGHAFVFAYLFDRLFKRRGRPLNLSGGVPLAVSVLAAFAASCMTSAIMFPYGAPLAIVRLSPFDSWVYFLSKEKNGGVFLESATVPALLFLFYLVCLSGRSGCEGKEGANLREGDKPLFPKDNLLLITGAAGIWLYGISFGVIGSLLFGDSWSGGLLGVAIFWTLWLIVFILAAFFWRYALLKRQEEGTSETLLCFICGYLLACLLVPANVFSNMLLFLTLAVGSDLGGSVSDLDQALYGSLSLIAPILLFFLSRAILRRE